MKVNKTEPNNGPEQKNNMITYHLRTGIGRTHELVYKT